MAYLNDDKIYTWLDKNIKLKDHTLVKDDLKVLKYEYGGHFAKHTDYGVGNTFIIVLQPCKEGVKQLYMNRIIIAQRYIK